MIEVRSLTRYYGRRCAVDAVSFTVENHEVIGLLGLNGAGKSTILKVLAGLLPPSDGTVAIDGVDLENAPASIRAAIGYLPEEPPLHREMTVTEFLRFAGGLRGMSSSSVVERLPAVLKKTQLEGFEHRVIDELSFGYRKRVGIAQAIVHAPRFVILDEPIGGLDPVQIVQMRKVVRGLKEDCTVLVSSHILSEISQTCDRIFVMHQGRLVAQGTEDDLASRGRTGTVLDLGLRGTVESVRAVLASHRLVASHDVADAGLGRVRARATLSEDRREDLVAALVGAGIGVRTVEESENELEAIFIGLTQEHPAAPGAGAA